MTYTSSVMRSPAQTRRLTRVFPSLQGYAFLPLIACMVIHWSARVGLLDPTWTQGWVFFACWVAAVAASAWISHLYGRRFGQVRFDNEQTTRRAVAVFGLFLVVTWLLPWLLVRLLGADPGSFRQQGPVAWTHVSAGLLFTAYGLYLRPAMPRFWLAGAAILLLAALQLGTLWPTAGGIHPFFDPYVGEPLLLAWWSAYALLSHSTLTRLFPPPTVSNDEDQP